MLSRRLLGKCIKMIDIVFASFEDLNSCKVQRLNGLELGELNRMIDVNPPAWAHANFFEEILYSSAVPTDSHVLFL